MKLWNLCAVSLMLLPVNAMAGFAGDGQRRTDDDSGSNPTLVDGKSEFAILRSLDKRVTELVRQAPKARDGKAAYTLAGKIQQDVVEAYLNRAEVNLEPLLEEIAQDFGKDNFRHFRNSLIFYFLKQGDPENLTRLLSVNCPVDRMGLGESIESAVAMWPETATKGKEILVLCDAWSVSKSPENRRRLIVALRRGFQPMGITADDDAEFVAKVRKWKAEQRDSLVPNEDYRGKYGTVSERRTDIPLYIPASEQRPARTTTLPPPYSKD